MAECMDYVSDSEERDANARLIEIAPILFETAKAFVEAAPEYNFECEAGALKNCQEFVELAQLINPAPNKANEGDGNQFGSLMNLCIKCNDRETFITPRGKTSRICKPCFVSALEQLGTFDLEDDQPNKANSIDSENLANDEGSSASDGQ